MPKKYARKELLDYLRHFWYEMNRSPRKEDFLEHQECPSIGPYEDRFGSWNDAKEEAGVPLLYRDNIPEDELIKDLQQADKRTDGFLSFPKYKEVGNFSQRTYEDRFGSWNDAKKEAGLETTMAGSGYTDEYLLDYLDTLWSELGHMPEESDMLDAGGPTAGTYRNHFDSFTIARKIVYENRR